MLCVKFSNLLQILLLQVLGNISIVITCFPVDDAIKSEINYFKEFSINRKKKLFRKAGVRLQDFYYIFHALSLTKNLK